MDSRPRRAVARTLLAAGLLVGVLDITYAWLFWYLKAGVGPRRIFQSVASGVLGREAAVAGGWPTALLGLALHFFIATTIVTVYFLAARRMPALWRRAVSFGLAYGVAVYLTMTYVVVPLSRAPGGGAKDPLWIALSVAVHMLLIGLPSALAARRLLAPASASS